MAHATTYTDLQLVEFLRHRRQRQQESNKKSIGMGTLKSSESAEMLAQFDAAIGRLEQLARLSPLQQQFLDLVLRIDPATEAAPVKVKPVSVQRMTGAQAESITRLANHPLLSQRDKVNALLQINRLSEEQAPAYIAQLSEQVKALELAAAGPDLVEVRGPEKVQVQVDHPALQASSYDLAREAYIKALQLPGIHEEERRVALGRIDIWTEAELLTRTAAVQKLADQRQAKQTQAA